MSRKPLAVRDVNRLASTAPSSSAPVKAAHAHQQTGKVTAKRLQPVQSKSSAYDDGWAEKQDNAFCRWINNLILKDVNPLIPSRVAEKGYKAQTMQRREMRLRLEACKLFESEQMQRTVEAVEAVRGLPQVAPSTRHCHSEREYTRSCAHANS